QLGKTIEEARAEMMVMNDPLKNYYTAAAYASVYTKVSNSLKAVIKSVDSMRNFYLVEVMLNQLTDDALAPMVGSDEIIEFTHPNEGIKKELKELKKKIGLDQLILDITPDLLAYGEYVLKTKISPSRRVIKKDELKKKGKKFIKNIKGEGILDVMDCVEQGTVITLSQDGQATGYLVFDEISEKIQRTELADYIKFSLGGKRIKIDTKNLLPSAIRRNSAFKDLLAQVPRFIRQGKSVLYPVLEKIKELEILEKLVPATRINKLSQGNLVALPLPEGYSLEEATSAARRIEGMINKKVAVDPVTKEITVEAILSTAGRTRVIPQFGDKGRIDSMDYKTDDAESLSNDAKDLREIILDSIGIPSELIYKSEGDSKNDILKRYAKYLRKLKMAQKALVLGCKQIACIHLANKGYKFKEDDIGVNFINALIEIDNLDRLEHTDVTISLLNNVREFFNDMSEADSPYRPMIRLKAVAAFLDKNLNTVGLSDAIDTEVDLDKENLDIDGDDDDSVPPKAEPDDDEDDGKKLAKDDDTEE
ncbi:MAG: hypothetical protein KAR20_09120, partial [Candidatus Heimdallarchaeota archaeon]|nr:hypothetical protein [Candidatus Heimdallarchaeota archaeon]